MTTAKRALIVDDSRSARVILSRMLEQHGLTVDTAESAEQALEYLQRTRPDVIFMDHLMPGMDGFQAVQAIKADALTATIPLMMYTSQEGELYVSQARALGAVGVLPKTVRPVDVSRVLYQLHLLPDRRALRTALFPGPAAAAAQAARSGFGTEASMAAALAAGVPEPNAGAEAEATGHGPGPVIVAPSAEQAGTIMTPALLSELQVGLRASMHQMVKDQLAEQRRFMLATFEAFARRLTGEVKDAMTRVPPIQSAPDPMPSEPRRQWWPVALTALLAVIPAAVLGVITWQASITNRSLARDLADARASLERARAELEAAATAAKAVAAVATVASTESLAVPAGAGAGMTVTEYVPYGEPPLAGTRLDRLRAMSGTLEAQQFRGKIRVESFVGDFCLTGSATDGFAIAAVDLAVPKCDFVGNPFDDSLSPAQRQSLDFANFSAMLRQRTAGAIRVEVANAGRTKPVAYPEQDEKTTAGAWNIVAAQNNRVEFHVIPEA